MFRRMLGACVVLVWTLTLPACAALVPPYSAEAIEARVVDADTKQPLEGVIVTANWELRGGGLALGGSTAVGQIQVMEAVTDQNGRFFFPAWGPIKQFKGELHDKDPQLLFFKSGYAYRILWNDYRGDPPAMKVVHRSQWNGKTIEMKRFRGTMQEYSRHLSYFSGNLRFIEDDCQWKQTPRILLALQEQADKFKALGIVTDIYRIDYMPTDEKKCGSVKEFFQRDRQ